jgi:hypothetical protein
MSWVFSSPRGSRSTAPSGATCHWLPHTSLVGDRTTHDHHQAAVPSRTAHGAARTPSSRTPCRKGLRRHTSLTDLFFFFREPDVLLRVTLARRTRLAPSCSRLPTPQSFIATTVRTFPARRPSDSIRSTAPGLSLLRNAHLNSPTHPTTSFSRKASNAAQATDTAQDARATHRAKYGPDLSTCQLPTVGTGAARALVFSRRGAQMIQFARRRRCLSAHAPPPSSISRDTRTRATHPRPPEVTCN